MTKLGDTYDVAIAGAGPAGTSAAIHLATQGARVLLVEQKRFHDQNYAVNSFRRSACGILSASESLTR